MKRELKELKELLSSPKHIRRNTFSAAGPKIAQMVGPGKYLDSQTSDTQFFGFVPNSSDDMVESQVDYGNADDDLYRPDSQSLNDSGADSQLPEDTYDDGIPKIQSQFPEIEPEIKFSHPSPPKVLVAPEVSQNTSDNSFTGFKISNHPWDFSSDNPQISIASSSHNHSEWGPNTLNQKKLDRLGHWDIMRQDDQADHPARLALLGLTQAAGMSDHHELNPVRQGHVAVASFLIRIANELICNGGTAEDMEVLRNAINDGHAMLDVAGELVDMEEDAHAFIQLYQRD
ncbi:hypothetical protein VKT23_013460 [Stygiomarasmius scandens]|uniref:Uncharacterized protein n=1 Tax=Marasmiellus scandens TaxID=2682957 RepID=A0ABR1J3V5_9AGAR